MELIARGPEPSSAVFNLLNLFLQNMFISELYSSACSSQITPLQTV
ncbi:hypothetical protein SETIT_8G066300v2 [Setaria italica]|uniref:Uncharacterized protein n=1 Tax=Setaria italica TaxID=4555 RepID=A0A368S6K7_SETIT|nr:hypothetical protein SETIT_8G066300v2 [Setaria italica]